MLKIDDDNTTFNLILHRIMYIFVFIVLLDIQIILCQIILCCINFAALVSDVCGQPDTLCCTALVSDVCDQPDPLLSVKAGLVSSRSTAAVPLTAVHVRAKLLDLSAQVGHHVNS